MAEYGIIITMNNISFRKSLFQKSYIIEQKNYGFFNPNTWLVYIELTDGRSLRSPEFLLYSSAEDWLVKLNEKLQNK